MTTISPVGIRRHGGIRPHKLISAEQARQRRAVLLVDVHMDTDMVMGTDTGHGYADLLVISGRTVPASRAGRVYNSLASLPFTTILFSSSRSLSSSSPSPTFSLFSRLTRAFHFLYYYQQRLIRLFYFTLFFTLTFYYSLPPL